MSTYKIFDDERMNKLIDSNYYTTECAHNSNTLHRPIGIGVQGYADVFALLSIITSWVMEVILLSLKVCPSASFSPFTVR